MRRASLGLSQWEGLYRRSRRAPSYQSTRSRNKLPTHQQGSCKPALGEEKLQWSRPLSLKLRQALLRDLAIPLDASDRIARAVVHSDLSYPLWVTQLVQQAFSGILIWQLTDVERLLWRAERLGLDPLQREIIAITEPAEDSDLMERIGSLITVDGWMKLLHQCEDFQGLAFDEGPLGDEGAPDWVACSIFRKRFRQPLCVKEYAKECMRDHPAWHSMPGRMLKYRALAQAARLALGIQGYERVTERRSLTQATASGASQAAAERDAEVRLQEIKQDGTERVAGEAFESRSWSASNKYLKVPHTVETLKHLMQANP